MPSMRIVHALLGASLGIAVASGAAADNTDGVYLLASEGPAQTPGALAVPSPRGTAYYVPGPRVAPSQVTIAARDNANTRYDVDVRYARGPGVACDRGLLRLGARVYVTGSWGGDDALCSLSFELDPAEAQRAAAVHHTTRQDRHPVGDLVVGTFTTPRARYRVGEPIEMGLTMTNPVGAPPVAWEHGGQNRGPRDDQFDFVVTRDGQPVAPIEAMNFGGLSFMDALGPGDHDEVRTPLAPWADLSRPGHYVVTCSFGAVFAPAGVSPHEPATRGQAWDRTFTGTVAFDVVP